MLSVRNLLSGFLYLRAICRFLSFHISFVFEWAVRRDEFGECCSFAVRCLCFWMCGAPKPSLLKAVTVGLPPPARAGILPTGSAYELASSCPVWRCQESLVSPENRREEDSSQQLQHLRQLSIPPSWAGNLLCRLLWLTWLK